MTDTKIVTFKKEWRGYAIGEIAGFDSEAATALIKSGRAVAYVPPVTSGKTPSGGGTKKTAEKKGGKTPEAVDPVDPVDPIDPLDPVDLVDPIDPVDAIDPEELDEKP